MPSQETVLREEKKLEAEFGFVHSRVRGHAESIAFFDGGERERDIADKKVLYKKEWGKKGKPGRERVIFSLRMVMTKSEKRKASFPPYPKINLLLRLPFPSLLFLSFHFLN